MLLSDGKLNTFRANGHKRVRPRILAQMRETSHPFSVSDGGQKEMFTEELSKYLSTVL